MPPLSIEDDDINPLDSSFYIPVDQSEPEDNWEFLLRYPDEDDTNLLDIPVDRSPAEDNWEHQLKYGE